MQQTDSRNILEIKILRSQCYVLQISYIINYSTLNFKQEKLHSQITFTVIRRIQITF